MNRRDAVLATLKADGEASLDGLARQLGISKQATLRHLEQLRADGLVETQSLGTHTGPGRPAHFYRLTPAAAQRFPQAHRELATDLVHFLDSAQLERFFAARATRLEAEYGSRVRGRTLRARLEQLAEVATEKGHMASVVEMSDGSLGIRQCNCPIGDVAAETRLPCRHEHEMYARLLGAELERVSFMPEADANCTYVVKVSKTGRKKVRASRGAAAAN